MNVSISLKDCVCDASERQDRLVYIIYIYIYLDHICSESHSSYGLHKPWTGGRAQLELWIGLG